MSKHKGSSHKRRESVLERKATQHPEFVGDVAKEHEATAKAEAVQEMAHEFEDLASGKKDGSLGPEIPFRIPRSVEEGKKIIREAPEVLREKARERLEQLPEPARKAVELLGAVAGVAMVPLRFGWNIARDLMRVPVAMFHVLRQRET